MPRLEDAGTTFRAGRAFEQLQAAMDRVFDRAATELASRVRDDIMLASPVRTGNLRDSHRVDTRKEGGAVLVIEVSAGGTSRVKYARRAHSRDPWMDEAAAENVNEWANQLGEIHDDEVAR